MELKKTIKKIVLSTLLLHINATFAMVNNFDLTSWQEDSEDHIVGGTLFEAPSINRTNVQIIKEALTSNPGLTDNILKEMGFSQDEIKYAKKETQKIKKEESLTNREIKKTIEISKILQKNPCLSDADLISKGYILRCIHSARHAIKDENKKREQEAFTKSARAHAQSLEKTPNEKVNEEESENIINIILNQLSDIQFPDIEELEKKLKQLETNIFSASPYVIQHAAAELLNIIKKEKDEFRKIKVEKIIKILLKHTYFNDLFFKNKKLRKLISFALYHKCIDAYGHSIAAATRVFCKDKTLCEEIYKKLDAYFEANFEKELDSDIYESDNLAQYWYRKNFPGKKESESVDTYFVDKSFTDFLSWLWKKDKKRFSMYFKASRTLDYLKKWLQDKKEQAIPNELIGKIVNFVGLEDYKSKDKNVSQSHTPIAPNPSAIIDIKDLIKSCFLKNSQLEEMGYKTKDIKTAREQLAQEQARMLASQPEPIWTPITHNNNIPSFFNTDGFTLPNATFFQDSIPTPIEPQEISRISLGDGTGKPFKLEQTKKEKTEEIMGLLRIYTLKDLIAMGYDKHEIDKLLEKRTINK